MKFRIFVYVLFLIAVNNKTMAVTLLQVFDQAAYYTVIKDGTIFDIDREIALVDETSIAEKEAYKGTLLMKKAGLVKRPKEKLELFKSGRMKLETAMHMDNSNPEYHFLRLIIQEHAPKVTKYRAHLEEDSEYIKKNYNKLSTIVQEIVKDYSKTSKTLHPIDF